jgi:pimeloyl-ACP methyl ester carboxylesterase
VQHSTTKATNARPAFNEVETVMPAPFTIGVPDSVLADLRARLAATRLPVEVGDDNWDDGPSPSYLRELIAYWRDLFDWRAQESALNRFAHFREDVDGTEIHFIHERGNGPSPIPILLIHGYPDSFHRFIKLIPLLTDPVAHGGDGSDAFDVIVPSLPGYGFSAPRPGAGGLFGFGDVMHRLMADTLGYDRYAAHGGDWGSVVTELLARSHAAYLVGIHLTDVPFFHIFQKPDDLTPSERKFSQYPALDFRSRPGRLPSSNSVQKRTPSLR